MYASLLALGISPATVEFNLAADGSTNVDFKAWYFTGDLRIDLEGLANITVEPSIVSVVAQDNGYPFTLTFHGDPSLGTEDLQGYVRFMAMVDGAYTVGIKVRATIHHIAAGVPPEKVPWLSSWLPMEPVKGPPLPIWMGIFWPWYK